MTSSTASRKVSSWAKLAAVTLTIGASWAATAGVVGFSGTTSGASLWNRPVAGNPPTPPASGIGTAVAFQATAFTVDLADSYSLMSTSTVPAGWDNYTFLYSGAFDPTMPFSNVLIGNDDNPNIGVSGFNIALSPGITYHFVVTGFGNADQGAYNATISAVNGTAVLGNGTVPEPGSLALAGLALLGLARFQQRRKD